LTAHATKGTVDTIVISLGKTPQLLRVLPAWRL